MRYAVIGLGRMGLRHLECTSALGLEIVGGADLRTEAREAAAAAGVPEQGLFAGAAGMLAATRPEVVAIATTADSHAELTLMAVESGVSAVLCEKPMATSLADCDRMIEACAASNVALAVNHQMRFMEQYNYPHALVHGDTFGGLSSMSVVAGNFGMSMNGSHYFEAFRYVSGQSPARVSAWLSKEPLSNPRGEQFKDRGGCIRVEGEGGARFYMDASVDQGHGMHVTYAGRNGRLDLDELVGKGELVVRDAEHRDAPTTRYGMPWSTEAVSIAPADAVAPTTAVLDALVKRTDYPSGAVGRMAVEVLVAAHLSHEDDGRSVDLRTETMPAGRHFPWA